jgi:hypothetical protein
MICSEHNRTALARFSFLPGNFSMSRESDPREQLIMVQLLQHDDFTPHLSKQFSFEGRPQILRLASVEVSPASSTPAPDHRNPFILVFQGPRDDVMPEGLYTAKVEDGARFELYVVPIHTTGTDRQDYQAIFN